MTEGNEQVKDGDNTPESGEQVAALQQKLADAEAKAASAEGKATQLETETAALRQRQERLEDQLIKGLDAASNESTPTVQSGLDPSELSDTEKAIVQSLEGRIDKGLQQMRDLVATEKQTAADGIRGEVSLQSEVAQIKRENPELWELVGPLARDISRENPSLGVQGAWEKAKERFKPFIDSKTVTDKQREEEAEKATNEKPGSTGEPTLPPREQFEATYKELGIGSMHADEG